MNKIPQIIGIIAILAIAGTGVYFYDYQTQKQNLNEKNENTVVGNDRDTRGCIISAGYSWCEAKQKCLRTWEEKCEANQISPSSSSNNLQSCAGDRTCPSGYTCYVSQYQGMGPNGLVEGPLEGDLLCHKSCRADADCSSGRCTERELTGGDVIMKVKFCNNK